MTYRERRERRAERLEGWAEKRQVGAAAVFKENERYHGDVAFNTQPGHIPFRARVIARTERAFESVRKAEGMASRADTIRDQLDSSIYSDDPDAIPRLRERIAGLEAERDRIKAYNASCRRGQRDTKLLDERQRENLASVAMHSAYQLGKNGSMPAYVLQNLGGNITRQRQRLAQLEARARVRTVLRAEAEEEEAEEEPEPAAAPVAWGPEHFRPGDQAQQGDRWLPVRRVRAQHLEVDAPGCVVPQRWPYETVTGRRRPPYVAEAIEERRAELAAPVVDVRDPAYVGPGGQLALAL
jgi:Domain of unknown function (DUF3560)